MISDKVNNKDKETMIDIQKNLQTIKNRIEKTEIKFKRDPSEIKLIVVTKKFILTKFFILNTQPPQVLKSYSFVNIYILRFYMVHPQEHLCNLLDFLKIWLT